MDYKLWTDAPLVIDEEGREKFRKESLQWERAAYPLGNGRLGCTVFGDPACERVQFNEESFWVGNEDNTGAFQPFGDLLIEMGHDSYQNYRRELDIERALQTVTYTAGGVSHTREFFASAPARLIAIRLRADTPGALSGVVRLDNIHEIPQHAEGDTLVMSGDTSKGWYWQMILKNPERLIAGREYASEKNIDLDAEARARILHDGGSLSVDGDAIRFESCNALTILLAAATNYLPDRAKGWRGEHPGKQVRSAIADAAAKSFDELLAEHTADYQSLFGRLSLMLGQTPGEQESLPTARRVAAYTEAAQAGRTSPDRALETLLYQYARYLMIASSRGGLPSNLQGLWCISRHPSWRCDYHTDINVQMNYWFTPASNLGECFLPLAHWIDSIRPVRKEETERVLGVKRGWLMRSENGIFGGSTWHFQKGDSAWLCQNLYDYFTFSRDTDYLARLAYPVMKEICEFWIDHLKELPGGTLVVPEGRSPEHGPVGVDGVTYDQVLCWDLFNNTIEAAETLGVDPDFREQLTDRRERLLKPQIGRWGQLQEWMEDIDDPDDDHRHINHLICVYPGRQVHPRTTPELAEAARVGVTARRDHGPEHPGWSRIWKASIFARLLDGESAYEQVASVIAGKCHGNLWMVHPPFQIDCNFGYAAAINEMLVQSHMDETHLLPALPTVWSEGRVTGLRVRGGVEVDVTWQGGALTEATLRAAVAEPLPQRVRYGEGETTVRLKAGETCRLTPADFAS